MNTFSCYACLFLYVQRMLLPPIKAAIEELREAASKGFTIIK